MRHTSALSDIQDWRERCRRAHYTATGLAKLCNVSSRTLRRFFHENLRTSLRHWLTRLRNNDAKVMLGSLAQIKEIAFVLGYKHPEDFSRQFKSTYGVSPQKWKRTRDLRNLNLATNAKRSGLL